MRDLKLGLLFVATAVVIAACGGTAVNNSAGNAANKTNSANGNTALPAPSNTAPPLAQLDGKQLFADNCMICHKNTAKGGPVTIEGKKLKPADLTRAGVKAWTDDKFVKDVQEGDPEEGMPSFKDKLKPEEIQAIVTYIRTLQG